MEIVDSYQWSSHQPLIKAVMELYVPKFVLELGIGIYSTPVFLEYDIKHLGVESNKEWIDHIQGIYKGINVLYHDVGEITIGMRLKELTESQKAEICFYYTNIKIPDLKPNLLFVDQYISCRTMSINMIGEKFDIVIYHDCEPAGIIAYDYNLIDVKGFNTYYLKTTGSWTAIMIKQEIDKGFNELQRIIIPIIEKYKIGYAETFFMELTDKY
ncbi:MAG: hypothetical protein MUO72_09455 [Bacteroidales bacterium]|nr:hypothetical protein [Bacteroidales bacterium]